MIALDRIESLIESARQAGLHLVRASDIEQPGASAVSTAGMIERKG